MSIETPAMDSQAAYDAGFFEALESGVQRSATAAAGLLLELFQPGSVLDVGCGTGLWLAALRERGLTDIFGVDGPWVPAEKLAIPAGLFRAHDLTQPFDLQRRFDVALCLEVAEHLAPAAAPTLVESLVRHAPAIVFSAAIPGQGGRGHINEQWPNYWVALFARHGYRCSTALRDRLWTCEALEPWYRQNMLCLVENRHAAQVEAGFAREGRASPPPLDIVHPDLFVRVRRDLIARTAYAERLEGDLRARLDDIAALRQEKQELLRDREELRRIRSSRAFRAYRRTRSAWRLAAESCRRLWPRISDGNADRKTGL